MDIIGDLVACEVWQLDEWKQQALVINGKMISQYKDDTGSQHAERDWITRITQDLIDKQITTGDTSDLYGYNIVNEDQPDDILLMLGDTVDDDDALSQWLDDWQEDAIDASIAWIVTSVERYINNRRMFE